MLLCDIVKVVELAQKNDFYGIGFDPSEASKEFRGNGHFALYVIIFFLEMQQLRLAAEGETGSRLMLSSVLGLFSLCFKNCKHEKGVGKASSSFGLSALEDADDIDVFASESCKFVLFFCLMSILSGKLRPRAYR